VKNQPVEGGRASENNAKRFIKKRQGIYVVLEPVKNPEAYMKFNADGNNDIDGDDKDGGVEME
jgi:hypothetical protein